MDPEKLYDIDKKLNIRGLTADRLRTIYYVASTQSATKAAEKLHICQSAVTKQIQQIEDEVGFLIFHRRDRKFIPTTAGEKLIQLAERTLHDIDAALKSIKAMYEGMGGTLKILTFPTFASVMLPRYIAGFQEKYPDIFLHVETPSFDHEPLEGDVLIRYYIPNNPSLIQHKLYDQTLGLFASRGYLEKFGEPQSLEDLEHHKILALDPKFEDQYKTANWSLYVGIQHKRYQRKPCMYLSSNEALASAVVNGLGIGGLAKHHMNLLMRDDLVQVLPHIVSEAQSFYFIFNSHVEYNAKYVALYEHIKSLIDNDKDLF